MYMQKILFSIFSCTMLACAASRPSPAAKEPLVYALDASVLKIKKQQIQSKDPAVIAAYNALLKTADKSLEFGPVSVMEKTNVPPSGDKHDYMSLAPYYWPNPETANGLPYIRKDGQTNPEVKEYKDKEYMPKLCAEVHNLGLAYYFSGDEKYAAHAATLVKVWFLDEATKMNPNLNFGQAMKGHNTGRGAGLIDTRHFVKLIDGIGLLEGSPNWKPADRNGMKTWFAAFLNWMETSEIGLDEMATKNNHGAWYDAQRLSMALLIGDTKKAETIATSALTRLDLQMNNDGLFPKELERTISLHYSTFVMDAFFNLAQMATHTNVDLWNSVTTSGKSMKKAFDVLKPYLAKEKEWTGTQIKPFQFEDGYALLLEGSKRFNCNNCAAVVKNLAAEKSTKLKELLLY